MIPVSDPAIISQLEGSQPKAVTDPNLIAQLEGGPSDDAQAPATPSQSLEASKAGRFAHGAMDPVYGMGQIVPRGLHFSLSLGGLADNPVSDFYGQDAKRIDAAVNKRDQEYDAAKKAVGFKGADLMRLAGNIASPANYAVGAGVSNLPEASTVLGKALQGAAAGAAYSATSPTNTENQSFGKGKLSQVLTGAATGGAISGGGEALASAIRPDVSEAAQKLLDEGVRLTPGQIIGGKAQTLEDALTSVPMLGDAIKSAKLRGVEDMNKAVASRALEPIGEKIPEDIEAGHDLVSYVQGKLGDAYDRIIPKLKGQTDEQFNSEIANLRDMAQNMPEQQAKQFEKILDTQVMRKIGNNGSISGESLKEIESQLGNYAKGYSGDANFDQRNLGNAISEVQNSIRGMMERSNPELAPELQKINEGYANFSRLRAAAASTGAGKHEGVFTPAQLNAAVRAADKSVGKGKYAKGDALMQDLSGAAQSVLPSTVPDSGSIGRALAAGAVLGHFSPYAAGGAAGASALYTRPGIALSEALLTKRPEVAEPIANAVRKVTSPTDLAKFLLRTSSGGQ